MISDERKDELAKYVRESAARMIFSIERGIPTDVIPGFCLSEHEHAYIHRCCRNIAAMILDNGARIARADEKLDDASDALQLSYAEHGTTMHERDELTRGIAEALGWGTDSAGGSLITPRLVLEGVEALVESRKFARSLLMRIGSARLSFSLDPGGPSGPAEGMAVIEEWISRFFKTDALALPGVALAEDSRSRGDLLAEISALKAKLAESDRIRTEYARETIAGVSIRRDLPWR